MSPSIKPAERVVIILPNKLGDSILSLPLILCLRKLAETYGPPGIAIEFVTYAPLLKVFAAVGVTDITMMSLAARIKSWIKPADKALFLIATSKNFGFYARTTYGLRQSNKWLVRFDRDLKFLRSESLPLELEHYLMSECGLPRFSVRQFGTALEIGYTVDQIKSAFTFSRKSLPINHSLLAEPSTIGAPYLICCMEAASGKGRRNDHRRWISDHYLTLATRIREQYGFHIAFVGIANEPPIPDLDGFHDLRGKLDLWQLFQLSTYASGYFGNDTGPLHMANLAGVPSVGVYPAENEYAPLFSEFNCVIMKPDSPEDVYPAIQRMIMAAGTSETNNPI